MLKELQVDFQIGGGIIDWKFPQIVSVTSWYGILDRDSWRTTGPNSNPGPRGWGDTIDALFEKGMAFVFDSYMGPAKSFGGRCTLCDLLEDTNRNTVEGTSGISFKKYPPTLLIVGDRDPLGLLHSARRARVMLETKVPWYFFHIHAHKFRMLKSQNFHHFSPPKVSLVEYPATHGFIGYPVQIQEAIGGSRVCWEPAAKAAQVSAAFVHEHHSNTSY